MMIFSQWIMMIFLVNDDALLSVNNNDSFSMNNSDFLSVNNDDSFSVNNDNSLSINNSNSFSINDDDFLSVNNDNFLSVNNDNSLHYHLNSFFVVKHRVRVIVNVDIIVCFSSYNIFTLENNIYNSFNMMILFLTNIFNIHVTQLWLMIIYLVQTYAYLLRFVKNSVS